MLGLFNDILGYILMAVLALCGIWFTIRTKGVQFRMVGEMFRLLKDKPADSTEGRQWQLTLQFGMTSLRYVCFSAI